MQLLYELGEARRPRGHALIYFRSTADPSQVLASYLVIPPIVLDLAKYIPPMFAGSLPGLDLDQLTKALPLPPIPEPVSSYDFLRRLAEARGDDLIAGGDLSPSAPDRMMLAVAEAAEAYAAAYREAVRDLSTEVEAPTGHELSVEEVLYELMSEADRLQELVKLVGKLRYGMETSDAHVSGEAAQQIEVLGRYLPESYRLDDLLAAARRPSATAARLSDLYIQRAYKLHHQQYADLIDIETQIRDLEAQAANE